MAASFAKILSPLEFSPVVGANLVFAQPYIPSSRGEYKIRPYLPAGKSWDMVKLIMAAAGVNEVAYIFQRLPQW
jgi:hypothetical protein